MKRLCGLDIDGVLNYYPECWVEFINKICGRRFQNLNDMKESLPYAEYIRGKEAYRKGSYKRNLVAREGASEFTRMLKILNFDIIAITSRPFELYPNLRMLTHEWLREKEIVYDDLFNSNKKHLDILRYYPGIEFMVEDNREFANNIGSFGYKVFLVNNAYNVGFTNVNVVRINEFKDILEGEIKCQKIKT